MYLYGRARDARREPDRCETGARSATSQYPPASKGSGYRPAQLGRRRARHCRSGFESCQGTLGSRGRRQSRSSWSAISSTRLRGHTPRCPVHGRPGPGRSVHRPGQDRPVNRAYGGRFLGPLTRGGVDDCVERRRRFEARETGVTILTLERPDGRWRAITRWACFPTTARLPSQHPSAPS
jgi:hypothetical protein